MVQGHQKWYSGLSNTQIHKYKYTNTQIHKYSIWERVRNTLHILIFLKSQWSKDIKNDILDCQIHKCTNTKTQIHKYTVMKCRKYPTSAIFSKSQGSKDIKNDILNCQKYKYIGDTITMYLQIWNYEPLTHRLTFALYHQVYSFDFCSTFFHSGWCIF